MENKAMLPDSTQSETAPPTSSATGNTPQGTRDGPSGSNTKGRKSDTSKRKKKRKSEDRTTKSSKKKKLGKDKAPKEQKPSKKSKKSNPVSKKMDPEEQDSDLDLENDLKPIRDYVKDREYMLQHMFKSVMKANKLQAMLPNILKDVKVDDLQWLCLLQLEGMSKSRIMSILAGEEMQSSSDDDDSDSDLERVPLMPDDDVDDALINSEVVDSTSSLPQASLSVGDVEEAVSMQAAVEEAAGEEANEGAGDVEDDAASEGDEDAASIEGSWQDDSDRQQRYYDEDAGDEVDDNRQRYEESDADSLAQDDRDESQEEEAVVKKAKKFRRIKIVRAEGEECEEGEITSDEVETDEESITSIKGETVELPKPQEDTVDVDPPDAHPGADVGVAPGEDVGAAPGEDETTQGPSESSRDPEGSRRVSKESITNSGNQGDNDDDDDFVDADDASVHVVIDPNVAKDVADAGKNVASEVITDEEVADDGANISVITDANVLKDISGDSLNIFAEDNLELDLGEASTFEATGDVVDDSDITEDVVKDVDDDNASDNATVNNNKGDVDNDRKSETSSDDKIDKIVDDSNGGADESSENNSNADIVENTVSVTKTESPPTQGKGLSGTAKLSGRKVAQQLEVLELELRARAIRSLMKQYGKDVG